MKRPFTLIQSPASEDLVEALEFLLDGARSGDVIGIAYAAQMKPRRSIIADSAGELHRNPLFALSLLHVLMAQLTDRVRAEGRSGA
jgi:hypothetical protein